LIHKTKTATAKITPSPFYSFFSKAENL
jgi:hypothetical protein